MKGPMPSGIVFVLAAAVLWGTTGTAAAMAPGVGPLAIAAAAMGIGGLLQAAAASRLMLTHRGELAAQWRTVMVSAVAVAVFPLAFYSSMRLAGVAVGTVVSIGSAPPAAAVIERIVDHQPFSRGWALGTTVGVSGVLAIALAHPGPATITATAQPGLGIALGLLAGFTYALYSWGAARVMRCGLPSQPVMGAVFGLGGILLLPVLALTGPPSSSRAATWRSRPTWLSCPCSWDTSSSGVDWPPSQRAPQPRCLSLSPPWLRSSPSSCWANTCRPSDGWAWG
jgi:drug/metabolite transporter, DME family